jgi:hypothetical protein
VMAVVAMRMTVPVMVVTVPVTVVVVFQPTAVKMRRRIVLLLLIWRHPRVRMGQRRQLAGEKPKDRKQGYEMTQHRNSPTVSLQFTFEHRP